ncbi:hypothetical protein DFH11DRAFT_1640195 [Phellopilus nigrolimitatus]|nr:hypothetical protein DFH11DRAFT_1640195 [Phellopilus nigrolimitatus]
MPGPAVYVVAVVGTVAVGFMFKNFVFDPYVAPKLEQWREEFRARRQAHAQRRRHARPHTIHEDSDHGHGRDMSDTGLTGDAGLSIPLDDFGSSTSHDFRDVAPGTEPRRRRPRFEPDETSQSGVIDGPFADIPYEPIVPVVVDFSAPESHNPWSALEPPAVASRPASPPSPRSPFSLGSSSVTLTSPQSSPRSSPTQLHRSLDASRVYSPVALSPRVQLPTPSASESPASQAGRLIPLPLLQQSVPLDSSAYPIHHMSSSPPPLLPSQSTERLTVVAPAMSSTQTSSELSFNTAMSPPTEFLSPESTQFNSPFSDSMALSEYDSFHSDSTESLDPAGNTGDAFWVTNSEPDRFDDLSDNSSDGSSEGSWVADFGEPVSGAMSPRH